jgi:hypothetical protein
MIVGAHEHPGRELPDRSVAQIHAEVALGALNDAGLTIADVDGYFCAGDAPGRGGLSMTDYLGLNCSYVDTTELGGAGDRAGKVSGCASYPRGQAPYWRRCPGFTEYRPYCSRV